MVSNRIHKSLGIVAMHPKGQYDSNAYYEKLNIVEYAGATYVAKQDSHGILPTNNTYWFYLGGGIEKSDATLVFSNVAAMKTDTSLGDGMVVQTLGYYSINDGGDALYKIRAIDNSDTTDDMFIIELSDNNLVAELIIPDALNIKAIGANGDGITDDTDYFEGAISRKVNIFVPEGEFVISETLSIADIVNITGCGYDSQITYTGTGFLFDISTDLSHKPIIKNLRLVGTSENSCLKCNRNAFGGSFIIENCVISQFNVKVFELTSVFDPIIRNVRIISAGKILFNTYDGEYGENSFSNNILFEHVYYTGNPNPATLLFDLNNVRYLHCIGCQFEKITKLIEAKNKTKYVILDHSWVEQVTNFYSLDGTSEIVRAINTQISSTTNYNQNYSNIDYLDGNDKEVVNIKTSSNDTYNVLQSSDNIVLDHIVAYNSNNNSYPYQQVYTIGTKETRFNTKLNLVQVHVKNGTSVSSNLKHIDNFSGTPMLFDVYIDCAYSNSARRMYSFKIIKPGSGNYARSDVSTILTSGNVSSITDTIDLTNGTLSITSTDTMARCIMVIQYRMIGDLS